CDTAGSLTPSAFAAAVTDPSLATSTNALSCVRVMTLPIITQQQRHLVQQIGRSAIERLSDCLVGCTPVASLHGRPPVQVPAYVDDQRAARLDHAPSLLARFRPHA